MSSLTAVFEARSAVDAKAMVIVRGSDGARQRASFPFAWSTALPVDWKFDPRQAARHDDFLEEEPPPPDTEAPGPGDGKMALPSAMRKTGLYAMKDPSEASSLTRTARTADFSLAVGNGTLHIVEKGSKRTVVASAADLAAVVERMHAVYDANTIPVHVADDVPWSQVLDVLAAACGAHWTWQLEPTPKP